LVHPSDAFDDRQADTRSVYAAGPRVDRQYLAKIARLDDPKVPIAETYRRIRGVADEMGVPRPSYERVRVHLRASRTRRARRNEARELALQLAFNTRSAELVVQDLLALIE
jgi:hypothetical protein